MNFNPTRLTLAEHSIVTYFAAAPDGATPGDVLKSNWAHAAHMLRPGHEVIVVAGDGSWRLHLYCRDVKKNSAAMAVISFVDFAGTEKLPDETPDYEIKFRGPRKFSIIRLSDDAVIHEDIQTKEEAEQKLKNMQAAS